MRATIPERASRTPPSARPGLRSPTPTSAMPLSRFDLEELGQAKRLLEHPGIATRLTAFVGAPVEKGMKLLPSRFQKAVHAATEKALTKALDLAVGSLGKAPRARSSNRMHAVAVATSGA